MGTADRLIFTFITTGVGILIFAHVISGTLVFIQEVFGVVIFIYVSGVLAVWYQYLQQNRSRYRFLQRIISVLVLSNY